MFWRTSNAAQLHLTSPLLMGMNSVTQFIGYIRLFFHHKSAVRIAVQWFLKRDMPWIEKASSQQTEYTLRTVFWVPQKNMLRQQVRAFHASSKRMNFSKMTIVGRIGSDFTEYTSSNNNKYLKYSIASQPRRDGPTNWFNITVFSDPQMNFLTQYVRKGYVQKLCRFSMHHY